MVVRGITPNRAIFLYNLRVNPKRVHQIIGMLKNSVGDMCAIGLGCDAFNIVMTPGEAAAKGIDWSNYNPYAILAEKLEVVKDAVTDLYYLNDRDKLSFAQVAKVAEEYFNSNQLEPLLNIKKRLEEEGEL